MSKCKILRVSSKNWKESPEKPPSSVWFRHASLTVVVCPQARGAGVVVGGPGAGRRGHGEHVREVLPEVGEQEDRVRGGLLDDPVERRAAVGRDARLLQGEQVVGPAVGLLGRVPADDDDRGAEDLHRQVVDGVVGHWEGQKDSSRHWAAHDQVLGVFLFNIL